MKDKATFSAVNYLIDNEFGVDAPLLGTSPLVAEVRRQVEELEGNTGGILLQGEPGTGRWMVALRIHLNSTRQEGPFVILDCADTPLREMEKDLTEPEGRFGQAAGGTILIEQVTALTHKVQKELFDFLYNGKTDARIICSSHEDVHQKIRMGMFREDLCQKICPHSLILPPLRSRPEDIPQLANFYIQLFNRKFSKNVRGLSANALDRLQEYSWPGNLDQLRITIERLVMVETEKEIREELLPVEIYSAPKNGTDGEEVVSLKEMRHVGEKQMLIDLLRKHNGNQSKVSRILGVHRNTVLNKIKEFDINPRDYKGR